MDKKLAEKAWEILNADLDTADIPAEILALKASMSFAAGLSLMLGNAELIMDFDINKHRKVDWGNVPKDAKIYVRHKKGQPWATAHFAYCENGYVYAYPNGKTSFTADCDPFGWKHAKLADEDV